ncbi:cytochrome P450 [Nocardioides sp.]|uniref:cytochrome P450 n=1 Tax=Nocardioides sp. TaxID=35761 RepID=UPI0035173458
MTSLTSYDPIDISSHAFWAGSDRERDLAFAELRRERPVSWHPPAEGSLLGEPDEAEGDGGRGPGYWAVVRHGDVEAVSRDHRRFSSAPEHGGVMFEDVPAEVLEMTQSILAMDEPRHNVTRRLLASAFTPRRIRVIEEQIRAQAAAIVDAFLDEGPRDLVEQVSTRLPLWTISEMLGVPQEDRARVVGAVDQMVGLHDPAYVGEFGDPLMALMMGIGDLHDVAQNLIDARRSQPADDLMSALVQAEVDGERLSDDDIRSYFVLLAIAGNDTTRNTTTHGLLGLAEFPDQRDLLLAGAGADLERHLPGLVEESIRWGSAVMTFRRTALEDVELGGRRIAAGEKVVLFYSSANRDETVFADPWRFDLTRDPNPHVGFGGGGIHYCLGHHVARAQLRALFRELLTRVPDLVLGEPEMLAGHFMHAVKRLPCSR